MLTQQVRAQREAQPGCLPRWVAGSCLLPTHGETGIIGQYGTDTHQDSVVHRPQLVGQGHGQRTAQRNGCQDGPRWNHPYFARNLR